MTLETPHTNVVRYLDFCEGPQHYFVPLERLSAPFGGRAACCVP